MIYLIGNEKEKICKIGFTENNKTLKLRLPAIQTGNHLELKILNLREGCRKLEKHIHFKLHKYKKRGEWFTLNKEVLDAFSTIVLERLPARVYLSFWKKWMTGELAKSDLELLAYLMMNYARGVPFNISDHVKSETSKQSGRSSVSYNTCTKRLLESGFILPVKPNSRTYILNPEYAFEGSSKNRKKAIIDLNSF